MLWGNVSYERKLRSGTELSLRYQIENKDYNQNFNERDLLAHLFRLGFEQKWNPKAKSWFALESELGRAKAKDADPEVDPDTSYRQIGLKLGGAYEAEGGLRGSLTYSFFRKSYTADNTNDDPFHAGKDDDIHNVKLRLVKGLSKDTRLFFAYEFEKKDSNIDVPQNVAKSESLSYTNNSVSLGLQYEF